MLCVVITRRVMKRSLRRLRNKKTKKGVRSFSTSPYPFRPGYGLGSWIPPVVIEGMESEGIARARVSVFEQILTDLDSTAREIQLEMNSLSSDPGQTIPIPPGLENYQDQITKARTDMWGQKITALTDLFNLQKAYANSGNPQLMPQAFNAGAASPVKWGQSKIAFLDRASDSLTVNARFFNFDKNTQSTDSHAFDVSSAASEQVRGFGGGESSKVATAVHEEVSSTASRHDIESTLLLVAKATHSKVMQFENLEVDELLLRDAWNFYHGNMGVGSAGWGGDPKYRLIIPELSPGDLIPKEGDEGNRQIFMVDECFMGSCLVGTVHLVKQESTSQSTSTSAESAKASVEFSAWFGAISGDASVASSAASSAASLASQGGFDVKFSLMCLGYCPTLKSNDLMNTVKVIKDFDPAGFKTEGGGSGDKSGGSDTKDGDTKSEGRAQAIRQSNMKSVIKATIGSVKDEASGMKVLDFNSFMNAFDDYCENAPKKDGVGIPIGLNVRAWGRHNIATLLWNKYIVGGAVPGLEETGGTRGDGKDNATASQ